MTKKGFLFSILVAVTAIAVGQAITGGMSISINGKTVPGKTLVSKGETYVPLSSLKAAGVTVSAKGTVLSLGLTPAGGANQVNALEGKVGDWLFNGIWRFRVISVAPTDDGRAGWKVAVELRNGTKLDNVALGGTGFESLKLFMADGNPLGLYNVTDIDRPITQGGSVNVTLIFYDDDGNGRKPDKLILRISPDKPTVDFLRGQGASYTVGDPSFRVNLKQD